MKRIASSLVAFATLCAAAAELSRAPSSTPPVQPLIGGLPEASAMTPPSAGLVMGRHAVKFEISTLDSVIQAAGVGTMLHEGDAGGSQYWICYRVPSQKGSSTVWIISHGEMGGRAHYVTSAVIAPTASIHVSECPELPSTMQPVVLSNGIKLGDDVGAVLRVLGPPQLQRESSMSFSYEGKVHEEGKCDGGFDRANWLSIEHHAQTVRSVHAGQVTSC